MAEWLDELVDTFLDGRIEALEFESSYLSMFKTEIRPMSEEAFRVLDRLFADVDAFCADPTLRDEHDLDEEGLRQATSARRPAATGLPVAIARHLGWGAEHWPVSPGDEEVRRAFESATSWYPVPTLTGEEWCPLLTDLSVALAFHAHASKFDADVALLAFGLTESHRTLGWDLGTPAGGHSVIPHELGLPPSSRGAGTWLNDEHLFRSREAALTFWSVRQRLCSEHPEWEEPSGWAIVHVARLDIEAAGG